MSVIIHGRLYDVPGGIMLLVEHEAAYTKAQANEYGEPSTSRFEKRFVPFAAVRDGGGVAKPQEDVAAAIEAIVLGPDPVAHLVGVRLGAVKGDAELAEAEPAVEP